MFLDDTYDAEKVCFFPRYGKFGGRRVQARRLQHARYVVPTTYPVHLLMVPTVQVYLPIIVLLIVSIVFYYQVCSIVRTRPATTEVRTAVEIFGQPYISDAMMGQASMPYLQIGLRHALTQNTDFRENNTPTPTNTELMLGPSFTPKHICKKKKKRCSGGVHFNLK